MSEHIEQLLEQIRQKDEIIKKQSEELEQEKDKLKQEKDKLGQANKYLGIARRNANLRQYMQGKAATWNHEICRILRREGLANIIEEVNNSEGYSLYDKDILEYYPFSVVSGRREGDEE